ncbi:hypothetical protein [Piscinibacter terrae]|uniref:Uncharacterized protein n=1 Tax=Piscinibacter terrae TaxID=2496871 RepID=A0A3N7JY06_9BURK|nr:hypothetical protein [Albitalea terrae]RQP23755.1 hypothetical protein DZC73_16660 [Albitalea terrae]
MTAPASAPARIEVVEPAVAKTSGNDPFAALATAPNAASTPLAAASAASSNAATPVVASASASAASAPVVTAMATHQPVVPAKAVKPASHRPAHAHAEVVASQKYHTAADSTARDAKPAKTATNGRDPDVDLLAALMAHLGQPDAKGAKPNLDDTSIAKLVKRCESLSGDEAAQCQKRICDGYWGKAQACPAPTASKRE